jgi:hypothetical protein
MPIVLGILGLAVAVDAIHAHIGKSPSIIMYFLRGMKLSKADIATQTAEGLALQVQARKQAQTQK